MRESVGIVAIGQSSYFDCPEVASDQIEHEIQRICSRKPAIEIHEHDRGVHDRGFRYIVYQVLSRRPFDSDVENVARYLDTLAHHWFARLRGNDASRWHVEAFDDKCYVFDWSADELVSQRGRVES